MLAILLMVAMLLPACTPAVPDCSQLMVFCAGLVTDGGRVDDLSFNQAAWEGIQQAERERLVQWSSYIETVDSRDYEENISTFAEAGYDVIVTVGSSLGPATSSASVEYPGIYFIGLEQFQETGAELPNLAGLVFPEDQAGFLAGALAAAMSGTGQVGAVLGSNDYPPVGRYGEGFLAGAEYFDPEIEADVAYNNTADFEKASHDPKWGAVAANDMIDVGVDVIFGVGQTGDGALLAAARRGIYVIGAEVDQYYLLPKAAPLLLSSVVKLVEPAVVELIGLARVESFPEGNFYGIYGYAPFHDLDSKVPAEVKVRLEEIIQGLQAGLIETGVSPAEP